MNQKDDIVDDAALKCSDKLALESRKQAEASAVVAQYQHGTKLKVYKCKYCGLWHLASA